MKKIAIVLGSFMLIAAVAYPVFAWGPGWGRGCGVTGQSGPRQGYCLRGGGANYEGLSQEQLSKLDQLDQDFYNETSKLRNEIWTKKRDLNNLLNEKEVDEEKVRALHKEILDLKANMAEKRFQYRLEARKIAPESEIGWGRGRDYNKGGFGKGRGQGRVGGGFGPGGCWN